MPVVLVQSGLVVVHDLVHLVRRRHSLVKLLPHFLQMLLEPQHKLKHLFRSLREFQYLLVLALDLAVRYRANETVVRLDPRQLVLRRDLR